MAKKRYVSPLLLTVEPGTDPTINYGNSTGTSGEESRFTWDESIDSDDINMFWLSYDETDLETSVDGFGGADKDFYISSAEFYGWLESIGGW